MQYQKIEKNRTASTFMFISGCLGLITATALDKLYWRTDILAKGYPDFSQDHLIRSIVICVSMISILWALVGTKKPRLMLVDNYKFPVEILCVLGILSFSLVFLFLFIFEPIVFSLASLEDGPIEWISALLSFISCIIFVISFLKYRNNLSIPKFTKLSLALLALVFFMIGMEEVSWFQRVLDFETTKMFDGNTQNETNLHNFASDFFENAYYMGTFLFFVALPFIYFLFSAMPNNKYLRLLIARPYIAVIGTIPCAYNFDMWNISLTQISFFSSLVILISFAIFSNNKNEKYLIVFTIVLIVVTQGLFLIKGEEVFMRLQEITEYRELLIPLVFFIYSWDVSTYINRVYLSEKS